MEGNHYRGPDGFAKESNKTFLQVIKKISTKPILYFFIEQISYQIDKKPSKTKRKEFD